MAERSYTVRYSPGRRALFSGWYSLVRIVLRSGTFSLFGVAVKSGNTRISQSGPVGRIAGGVSGSSIAINDARTVRSHGAGAPWLSFFIEQRSTP